MRKLFQMVQPNYQFSFAMVYNARVYEPLRCQGALLSSYHKVTKRANPSKPTTSNGLYTLLAVVVYSISLFSVFFIGICMFKLFPIINRISYSSIVEDSMDFICPALTKCGGDGKISCPVNNNGCTA
jgi:hypothetical protein